MASLSFCSACPLSSASRNPGLFAAQARTCSVSAFTPKPSDIKGSFLSTVEYKSTRMCRGDSTPGLRPVSHQEQAHGLRRLAAKVGQEERLRPFRFRSEEHTSELQSQSNLVCRLLLE